MKKIILFGCGKYGLEALDFFGKENVLFFVDNNTASQGKDINGIKILSPGELIYYTDCAVIILSAGYEICNQMAYQLQEMGIECFLVYRFIKSYISKKKMHVEYFLRKIEDMSNVYELMYKYSLDRQKELEERLEFFLRYSDIRSVKPVQGNLRKIQMACVEAGVLVDELATEIGVKVILAGGNLLGLYRNSGFIPWDDDLDMYLIRDEYNLFIEGCKEKGIYHQSYVSKNSEAELYKEMRSILQVGKKIAVCENGTFMNAYVKLDNDTIIVVDIFPIDYYKNGTSYNKVLEYTIEKSIEKKSIDTISDVIDFNAYLLENNPYTSKERTKNMGFGLELINIFKTFKGFYNTNDMFPLIRKEFEGYKFWVPNNIEQILSTEYGDIYQWPEDAGKACHGTERHYIPYDKDNNGIHISSKEQLKDVEWECNDCKIIIDKYKINNLSDYFEIIEEIEKNNGDYCVYS